MIQLHNGGVVWQDGAVHPAPAGGEAARDKTMAYRILRAHNTGSGDGLLHLTFDSLISHDITYVGVIQTAKASGLKDAAEILSNVPGIGVIKFSQHDVVRHEIVGSIIKAYEAFEKHNA